MKYEEMIGHKFGRLTVLELLQKYKMNSKGAFPSYCRCQCDCGNEVIVASAHVRDGHTQSCGCLRNERTATAIRERSFKHGLSKSPLYAVWTAMKSRCYNPNNHSYCNYGDRGIYVCDEWRYSFEAFYQWAIEHGYQESEHGRQSNYTVDRIDFNGNYEPSNCRLVDNYTQANNTRKNVFVEYEGEQYTYAELARKFNINYKTFMTRIYRGHTAAEAVAM